MGKSKSKEEKPEKERRFSEEQYQMLLLCSERGDKGIAEWNQWRKENPKEEILFELANLEERYLHNVNLSYAILWDAHFENAKLGGANMKGANLNWAHLERGELVGARLECAKLIYTDLKGANLSEAHLENTIMHWACLEDSELIGTHLEGARMHAATVNGSTLILECHLDRNTDFRVVSLDSTRIDPGTKELLKCNIRRMNWKDWYKGESKEKWQIGMRALVTFPVRLFWWLSDYGRSTGRIILTFFVLAAIFALVYWLQPGCVMVNGKVGDIRGFVHAFYFSVVTMTTLGFGDIAANPDSWQGQVLLMVQVILGHVLLGALVTRFAVLFTAGGPAGKFAKR
jgi:uncharacterized protein YjbI with pentapeptide repeats